MKKYVSIILLIILLMSSTIQAVSATTIFLTSDNIIDEKTDVDMLNSIKKHIEDLTNEKITVIVDSNAPGPGEGTRAIESKSNVSVNLASSCAGNLYLLSKYSANSNKKIIFVNTGDFNLDNENSLRRAWDDNYSNSTFAGINNPGEFLNDSGVKYIQPLQEYENVGPNGYIDRYDENVNKYIAQEIVNDVNNNDNKSKTFDSSLIIKHELSPSKLAVASSEYLNSENNYENQTYNGFNENQLLYLTSSYLNGNALKNPSDYQSPNSPLKYSIFAKNSYSIYEYMEMGGIVKNYMDNHQQAPDYINYQGALISYYDLQHNFAKITENHTDYAHMDFEKEYSFDKVNDSIFIDILPIIIIIMVLLVTLYLFKKILIKIKRKKQ